MISTDFQKNVQAGDIFSVRSALIDYLIVDRTFAKFDEALAFASKDLDIIVPFDGKALQEDAASWDEDYINLAKVGVLNNFSRERINHLKTVIKTVMPAEQTDSAFEITTVDSPPRASRTGREVIREAPSGKPSGGSTASGSRTGRETIREEEKNGSTKAKASVGPAMIVGGAVVVAAGLAAEEALIIGAGIVVAGAGCVIALTK